MSSLTFFRDPFPSYTPPTSPRPPPNTSNTPPSMPPAPRQAISTPPKTISSSWPVKTTRDLESLKSAVLQPIHENDVSKADGQAPLPKGQSHLALSRRTVCNCASATKACAKLAIKRTALESLKPQTRHPIPAVGEQTSESAFPNPAIHSRRPRRPAKHNSAIRALNNAVQPAAKKHDDQAQRGLQPANPGQQASSAMQPVPPAREASQTNLVMTTAAATSDTTLLQVDYRRGFCTRSPARRRVMMCITEGPSLEEIREMRRRQDTVLPQRLQQKSTGKAKERLKHNSPAMRSLRMLL